MKQMEICFGINMCPIQYLHIHFEHGSYPRALASSKDTALALFGFIRPQLLILWYFSPVADSQTVIEESPEEDETFGLFLVPASVPSASDFISGAV